MFDLSDIVQVLNLGTALLAISVQPVHADILVSSSLIRAAHSHGLTTSI